MKGLSIHSLIVKWTGPYTYEEVGPEKENGLYAIFGIPKNKQQVSKGLHYVGITKTSYYTRWNDPNHEIWEISRERTIFLGEIYSYTTTDEREAHKLAEWMIVHFMHPSKNDKCTVNPPRENCALINTFYKKDNSIYERLPKLYQAIPDVMYWDANEGDSGILKVAQRLVISPYY